MEAILLWVSVVTPLISRGESVTSAAKAGGIGRLDRSGEPLRYPKKRTKSSCLSSLLH